MPALPQAHLHRLLGLQECNPVKIAQRFFGHANVSVTMVIMDAYSHVLRDMQTEVAKKIEEIFFWQGSITLASKGSGLLWAVTFGFSASVCKGREPTSGLEPLT